MKNKVIGILLAALLCSCPMGKQTNAGEDVDSLKAQITELTERAENAEFALAYFLDTFEALLNGDVNADGVTDAVDASLILGYYAYSSAHDEPVTLREYLVGVSSATESK